MGKLILLRPRENPHHIDDSIDFTGIAEWSHNNPEYTSSTRAYFELAKSRFPEGLKPQPGAIYQLVGNDLRVLHAIGDANVQRLIDAYPRSKLINFKKI